MKRLFYGILGVIVFGSFILSACGVPALPITDTPVVVTATNTAVPASPSPTTETSPTLSPTAAVPPTPGGLPAMPNKPVPQSSTFQGCPPQGDGGDARLNLLKNRIDEGNYVPVTFDSILSLTWPKTTERRDMSTWSAEDAAAIAKYEGIPVIVEGYLYGAKQSGSESTNCHATEAAMNDWHIWFTKTAGEDRMHSIVIEATPRIRALHQWTLAKLEQVAKKQLPVRISGWIFFDPEHPDQVLLTRGTIWEIHPILQIEVLQNNQWVPLDNFTP